MARIRLFDRFSSLWITLAAVCFFVVQAPSSSNAGGDDECDGQSLGSKAPSSLAGLAIVIGAIRVCKLCGVKCNAPHPYSDDDEEWWPWLHYVRVCSETKAPSGKMCIICLAVFRLCGLKQEHKSVSKYLKFKNEKDSVTRYSFFMKAQKKYLELCAVKGEDVTRLHVRQREHLSVFTVVHIVFDCVILFFACLY